MKRAGLALDCSAVECAGSQESRRHLQLGLRAIATGRRWEVEGKIMIDGVTIFCTNSEPTDSLV